jgi:hypothetical protein
VKFRHLVFDGFRPDGLNPSYLKLKLAPMGIKVSDRELEQVNLERDPFHGEWNYTIKPKHC